MTDRYALDEYKNYSTPTKKYRFLVSAVHSIYRLLNSTYELKELTSRMGRLFCQFFNAQYCLIVLLDQGKKNSTVKCLIKDNKKTVIDRRMKVSGIIEKRIIKTSSAVMSGSMLGVP